VAIHNAGNFRIAEELSGNSAVSLLIVLSSLAVKHLRRLPRRPMSGQNYGSLGFSVELAICPGHCLAWKAWFTRDSLPLPGHSLGRHPIRRVAGRL